MLNWQNGITPMSQVRYSRSWKLWRAEQKGTRAGIKMHTIGSDSELCCTH